MINDKLMQIARCNGYSIGQAHGFFSSMTNDEIAIAEDGRLSDAIGLMQERTKCIVEHDEEPTMEADNADTRNEIIS